MVLFSVIITTYNRPEKLLRAIQSVVSQSTEMWELIIINDGSTQDYSNITSFISNQTNIRYLWKKNEERCVARNTGISLSSGQFITFLDDDDYYLPHHLETLHAYIRHHQFAPALYHTHPIILDEEGKPTPWEIKQPAPHESIQEYYLQTGAMTMNCSCFAREILIKYPYDPHLTLAEDHHQRLRAMSEFPVIAIPEHTSVYDRTGDNSTRTGKKETLYTYIQAWRYNFSDPLIRGSVSKKVRSAVLFKFHHLLLNYHRKELSWSQIFSHSIQMLKLGPSIQTVFIVLKSIKWKLEGR